jgi:hypothetical protein
LDIDEGTVNCLTFGQFAQVFPLLPHMKKRAQNGSIFAAKAPKKLSNSIFVGQLVCGSNFSDSQMIRIRNNSNKKVKQNLRNKPSTPSIECDVTYLITVDMKHRIVIIKQEGNHSNECKIYQKKKGYLIMRRLITDYRIEIINSRFETKTLEFYGRDEIIKKPSFFKEKDSPFVRIDRGTGYRLDVAALLDKADV